PTSTPPANPAATSTTHEDKPAVHATRHGLRHRPGRTQHPDARQWRRCGPRDTEPPFHAPGDDHAAERPREGTRRRVPARARRRPLKTPVHADGRPARGAVAAVRDGRRFHAQGSDHQANGRPTGGLSQPRGTDAASTPKAATTTRPNRAVKRRGVGVAYSRTAATF